jgi:molybdenum cofactor guanylyltransferase
VYGSHDTSVKGGPSPTVAIVAGGNGSRLGFRHKGLIPVGETTLIEQLLAEAPAGPRWVVTNSAEAYAFLDVPLVADLVPGRGAPGGVVTALCVAQTEWVVIAACDMPNVRSSEFLRLLEARTAEVDVVCFARAAATSRVEPGRAEPAFEPMLGVYRASLGRQWLPQLVTPGRAPSLRALVDASRLKTLEVFDDTVLDSLNTPEQVRAWRARIG